MCRRVFATLPTFEMSCMIDWMVEGATIDDAIRELPMDESLKEVHVPVLDDIYIHSFHHDQKLARNTMLDTSPLLRI